MPIRPENKARYPADWPQIRERILARAGNCCEKCKVPNRERIARGAGDDANTYMTHDAAVYCADTGRLIAAEYPMCSYEVDRMVDIVLTIAHLDHTPENCADENLRAWCQRCHLRYDQQHHAETRAMTRQLSRRTAGGQLQLLEA